MKKTLLWTLLGLLIFSGNSSAQESKIYTHSYKDFLQALLLYNNGQYQASQTLFSQVQKTTKDLETQANCAYYIATSAIRLNQLGADKLMERFVERYPTTTKAASAYLDVADYYFDNEKYAYAIKWYTKAEKLRVGAESKEHLYFKKGYALFVSKKYKEAQEYFNKVMRSDRYGEQATYYSGYIAYKTDDYARANQYFSEINDSDLLQERGLYYQADMNFKLGNFQKALDLATKQLKRNNSRTEVSQLHKIIGESHFNLEQYQQATPYLKKYKGVKGKWSLEDYYQLGYAYYRQKMYAEAVSQFNRITKDDSAIAQNAYYHLAECYLHLGQKQKALNAFRQAAFMVFDTKIQPDAWLNYARLSYEIGNPYTSVPEVLNTYLEKYPNQGYKKEIEALLIDSYITSKNYEPALKLLEKDKSLESKKAYQKVAFYRAIEFFNNADYQQAYDYYKRSLSQSHDPIYVARALYWQAESDYLLSRYHQALQGFKMFLDHTHAIKTQEYSRIHYNIAYSYFKLKMYPEAIYSFDLFIKQNTTDKVRLNDSYLRIADSYFVTRQYWPAMQAYNKIIAIDAMDKDYAYYQKSISYGFVGKNGKKIEELTKFINTYKTSNLRDDALYELANTCVSEAKNKKAITFYDMLISEYPKGTYVAKAMLKKGLIYYNAHQNDQALTTFKQVVARFPNTQESLQAVATAKLIYVDQGNVAQYANWVKDLDFVEITDSEIDNASFEAAEKQFLQNNKTGAITSFLNYIKQFPKGAHVLQANFYIAEAYFSKDQKQESVKHYNYVINKERSSFTEQALVRLSEVYLALGVSDKAVSVLQRLESEADYPQNITFAQSNLMKTYYSLKNYDRTVFYANRVLQNPKIDARIKTDATIMIARSAVKTNNMPKAKIYYAKVLKTATGIMAAEALYYKAYFENKNAKYTTSNTTVQKLAKDYSGYKEFGVKGLIIMADNFYALEDPFNATHVLKMIIKNFKDYPEQVDQASKKLEEINKEEQKRTYQDTDTQNQ